MLLSLSALQNEIYPEIAVEFLRIANDFLLENGAGSYAPTNMFDRLIWQPDRMLLDDLVFRLEHYLSDGWDGGDHFRFYKIKKLVDQYENFFSRRPDFKAKHVLELGIYDGGSIAFWCELFRPEKHVALDIQDKIDSPYFRDYIESRQMDKRIKTYWNTDQADKTHLRTIVEREFPIPPDLVIDDASHLYGPTRASFETLFPLMAPGGLYIIEDWAWGHWPEYQSADSPLLTEKPLTPLVVELIEAAGTSIELISNIAIYEGFVVVERGPLRFEDTTHFDLDDHIVRRPTGVLRSARLKAKIKRLLRRNT